MMAKRVLVVEDEPAIALALEDMVEAWGGQPLARHRGFSKA
ncbi:hypothetical protein [Sphingomonas sp. TZW2008]|nr:hypothetical protein [Sphingomonas sp. TZW2008]